MVFTSLCIMKKQVTLAEAIEREKQLKKITRMVTNSMRPHQCCYARQSILSVAPEIRVN